MSFLIKLTTVSSLYIHRIYATGFKSLYSSPSSRHHCALTTDNQLKCWGYNNKGQLGYGDTTNRGTNQTTIGNNLQFVDLGSNFTAIDIAVGGRHTCAVSIQGICPNFFI